MDHEKITIIGPENTILGPESIKGSPTGQKKVNIKAFLLMAKYDTEIARFVFSDREKAMALSGIEFSQSERFLISALSDDQLKKNIDNLNLKGVSRKSLPSWKKATAVIMLLASILTTTMDSCVGTEGITPVPTPTEENSPAPKYLSRGTLPSNVNDS